MQNKVITQRALINPLKVLQSSNIEEQPQNITNAFMAKLKSRLISTNGCYHLVQNIVVFQCLSKNIIKLKYVVVFQCHHLSIMDFVVSLQVVVEV
jgi:hypothetical protein